MPKGKKKTHEQFIQEMNKVNPNIEILGTYINGKTKILCRCKLCKCEWKTVPADLLRHHGCPKCRSNAPKSHEKFVEEMKIFNPNIQILGKYIWSKSKIECKCKICLYKWKPMPSDLLKGHGCPNCSRNVTRTHEEFINEMKNINPNLEILGHYTNTRMKIDYECKICGKKNSARVSKLLEGCGCPHCSASKGERYIENILDKNNIQYQTQYCFDDCRIQLPLPFDFAIFDNNNLIGLCEYQGIQHYEPIDFAGKGIEWANNLFKRNQLSDNTKRTYCKNNNIPLLEIPYWEFKNTETILLDFIKEVA